MNRLRHILLASATVAALGGALAPGAAATGSPSPATSSGVRDALTLALRAGTIDDAQYALERAASAFDYHGVRARFGVLAHPGPRDATLLLRDLAVHRHELSGADRRAADALLARPDGAVAARPDDTVDPFETHYPADAVVKRLCPTLFCVNWVEAGAHTVPIVDANANQIPDYVDEVIKEMTLVWDAEIVEGGYRAPKSDADSPTTIDLDEKIDIYLVDLGSGLFGYCTTDDPKTFDPTYPGYDGSAYCVLDNDYEAADYGALAGLLGLQATAPHEFFHAVQFAYNAFQDAWFMESTATWMEEQVHDDLNSPRDYLSASQIFDPTVPLDLDARSQGGAQSLYLYGNFTFIQWLSELYDPTLIRDWLAATDGSPGHEPEWAAFALEDVLRARGSSFRKVYSAFGAAILAPPAFFEEGAEWFFDPEGQVPAAALAPNPTALTASRKATGKRTLRLDHMTVQYAAIRPGNGVRPAARLRVDIDLPNRVSGGEASLLVVSPAGAVSVVPISLNAKGNGSRTIPFGASDRVVIVLSNASLRFAGCTLQQSFDVTFTCNGIPRDDQGRYAYAATLLP
jgi:hypothetical protein